MNLDIRLPMGIMFALFGAAMTIYGIMTKADTEMYKASLGINVNLYWGAIMLIFGSLMIQLARAAMKKSARSGGDKPAA